MTFLVALLEAKSALERRRSWYTRTRARASWTKSIARMTELDEAIEQIEHLISAARAADA